MPWTKLTFGRYKGKTLPQILFRDPDWFFWAVEQDLFQKDVALKREATILHVRARSIRIPGKDGQEFVADYFMHPPTRKFDDMMIVPATRPQDHRKHLIWRKKVIDLAMAHLMGSYDKAGSAILLACAKRALVDKLGGLTKTERLPRMTKKRCEAFFDDPSNFCIEEEE